MGTKAIGNRGSYFMSGADGIGGVAVPDPSVGWTAVVFGAADVVHLGASDCAAPNGGVRVGWSFQASAAVQIDISCGPRARAASNDPEQNAGVVWDTTTVGALAANTIKTITVPFTAVRITTTGAAEVYICSR